MYDVYRRSSDPAMDAESYYASLPETLGTCPFCRKDVQETHNYSWSFDGQFIAHNKCYERVLDADWLDEIADCLEDEYDMKYWVGRFPA